MPGEESSHLHIRNDFPTVNLCERFPDSRSGVGIKRNWLPMWRHQMHQHLGREVLLGVGKLPHL